MDLEPQAKRPKLLSALSSSDQTTESPPGSLERSESETSAQCSLDDAVLSAVDDSPGGPVEKREAYYSANFKSVLQTVLAESPERHVISDDAAKVVEQFMNLPGQW